MPTTPTGDDASQDRVSYDRKELQSKKVPELRTLARKECGSGTWIAHARKRELITAILEGRPPDEIDAERKHLTGYAPNLRRLPVEEAETISHEALRLIQRVVSRELHPLRERIRRIETRLNRRAEEAPDLDPTAPEAPPEARQRRPDDAADAGDAANAGHAAGAGGDVHLERLVRRVTEAVTDALLRERAS